MKIGIIGTGIIGQTIGLKLIGNLYIAVGPLQ